GEAPSPLHAQCSRQTLLRTQDSASVEIVPTAATAFVARCIQPPRRPRLWLVIMERPAPDLQTVDYAASREKTVAQSHIQMGAGGEERTICRSGCPCRDDCGGSSGA